MGTAEENQKIDGVLNFLAPESTLKKSWEIHALVKNLLTQWETEKKNQGINQWKISQTRWENKEENRKTVAALNLLAP